MYSSDGKKQMLVEQGNVRPTLVCKDLVIWYFAVDHSIPSRNERKDISSQDIPIPWTIQTVITVADFLYNTHRYNFAIDFYEEVIELVGLLASESGLLLYCPGNEFLAYSRDMKEDLKKTKRNLQSDHFQDDDEDFPSPLKDEEVRGATQISREIVFYLTIGSTFYSMGLYMTSIWYFEKAAEMIKATGNKLQEQRTYTCLAIVNNIISRYDEAIQLQEKAAELSHDTGDFRGELECYNNLGSLYTAQGQFDLAINYYSAGISLSDKMTKAMAHNNVGNVYHASSKYNEAIHHHKESLRIRKEIDDTKGKGISYNNLSCDYYLLGQYDNAIKKQEKALGVFETIGTKKQIAVSHGNLGVLHQAQGRYELSLKHYEKGLEVRKEIGDLEGECRAYKEIKSVHDALSHVRDAAKYHKKALVLERGIIKKRENVATRANHSLWIAHTEKGLEVMEEIGVKEHIILYKIALSHTSKLNVLKASDHCVENIKGNESIRETVSDQCKVPFDEQSVPLYKQTALLMISFENYTDALLVLEQGRARALVDLIWRNYGIQGFSSPNFENLSEIISFFETQRENFMFMATLMDSVCFWLIDRLGNLRYKSFFLTKGALDDSLMSYFYSDRAEQEWQDKETRGSLNGFFQFLTGKRAEQPIASFLGQLIFAFAKELPNDEEIVFVPEGPLSQIPFPAMQDANHNYLVEKVRMRLIPSLTTLKILQNSPTYYHSKRGALLVGDPSTPDDLNLSRLPCAGKEVEMIGRLLGVSPLIDTNATKPEVLRTISNVSLVHISAHGSFERGEIALAGDSFSTKEDWLLTMEDIVNCDIRAKLVVLSCCHSAQGEVTTSEGIVGITRAFLGSGARSVLASLWAIEDHATLEFMKIFYTQLVLHKMSASRALQRTMNEMRESEMYNAVEHWASFTLYGEDVTIDLAEIQT